MGEQKLKHIEKQLCESFKGFLVDGVVALAPTGEPFVTYCSAGSKPEGGSTRLYPDVEMAVDAFEITVQDIIKTGKGTLYWRMRPRLKYNKNGLCCVWSRFIVSNRPAWAGTVIKHYREMIDRIVSSISYKRENGNRMV